MSFALGQRRTLAEIESQRRRSDPAAALFALVAAEDTRRRPSPPRAPVSAPGSRYRTRLIILFAVSVVLALACIALALAPGSRAGPAGARPVPVPRRLTSCARPPVPFQLRQARLPWRIAVGRQAPVI